MALEKDHDEKLFGSSLPSFTKGEGREEAPTVPAKHHPMSDQRPGRCGHLRQKARTKSYTNTRWLYRYEIDYVESRIADDQRRLDWTKCHVREESLYIIPPQGCPQRQSTTDTIVLYWENGRITEMQPLRLRSSRNYD